MPYFPRSKRWTERDIKPTTLAIPLDQVFLIANYTGKRRGEAESRIYNKSISHTKHQRVNKSI
jgi:hypothetical protein